MTPRISSTCYVVCIGINQYQHPNQLASLTYAEDDANALYELLGEMGVVKENRRLLLGKEANLDAVNDALDFIIDKPNKNDLVIFYFAGHSMPITIDEETGKRNEVFLATYDFDRQRTKNSRAFRQRYSLGMRRLRKDFFEGEGSRQRLFIFDSCHSGDFYGEGYRDGENADETIQNYIKYTLSSSNVGWVALSSCLSTQKAIEDTKLGHGLFTYYLLEALKGNDNSALREDGWLTVASLFDYLAAKLPDDQRPVLSGVQHDRFKLVHFPEKVVVPFGENERSGEGGSDTWDDVLRRSQVRSHRFLQEVQGTSERHGTFIREVFIDREESSGILKDFLDSDVCALILVGDSGIGKTSLLSWWTQDLLKEGHAVFIYNCVTFFGADIEREVTYDLSLKFSDQLFNTLEHIGRLGVDRGRQCILIFDALNEFRGDAGIGPEALLKHINSFVGRLPDRNVRVVLSCRTSTWKQLESLDIIQSFSSRYFCPIENKPFLQLEPFTPQVFETAYNRYQEFFHLQTSLDKLSADLRERLRNPLLLRMLAEAYQERNEPIIYKNITMSIFQRFYDNRVKRREDRLFVDELALEMLRQQRSTFAVEDLARNERLGPAILRDDLDSSYYRLLDMGILMELSSGPLLSDVVKFTYDRLGGYILAQSLMHRSPTTASHIAGLIDAVQQFPLAWDTARTLLVLNKDTALFAGVAQSANVELRELAVESLMEIFVDEPVTSIEIIKSLLQMDSQEVRRTALKAAYYIGPHARDIFLWAAIKGSPVLRRLTRDVLYLIWHTDPAFTYGLMRDLVNRVKLRALRELGIILEFVIDLMLTIYINHCEQEYVIEQTCDIYYELVKNKLHLDLFNIRILRAGIGPFIVQGVATSFSKPVLDTLLLTELMPAERFFQLSIEERACLKRVAPFMNPRTDLASAEDEIIGLLRSEIPFFNDVAAGILAIHAYHKFSAAEPILRRIFDKLGGKGQLWVLLSFIVLLPTTPPGWLGLVEEFTDRLIKEHPEIFFGDELSILRWCDIVLLPLGLVYKKRNSPMIFFENLIRDGLRQDDHRLVERCVEGLGAVGFYYPAGVFQTLRAAIKDLNVAWLETALVHSLSIMRVLHFDEVDSFLYQIGASELLKHRVSAATDVAAMSRYIYWIGFFNHCVHSSLFYPKMRQVFSMTALEILAEAQSPEEFITRYTNSTIDMAYEIKFQLKELMRSE